MFPTTPLRRPGSILDILSWGEPCSLFAAVLAVIILGAKLTNDSQRRWGAGAAILAFFGYAGYAWELFRPTTAEDLWQITMRSLAAFGLMLGISWTAAPIVSFLIRTFITGPAHAIRENARHAAERHRAREASRAAEQQRLRAEAEHARLAPERERARREADAQAQADAHARQRRAEARAPCELLYGLYAHDLKDRFPRTLFDEFVARHLGDDHPPEYVEARARQLQDLLQEHYEKIDPPPKGAPPEALLAWYEDARRKIEGLPLDTATKQERLAALQRRIEEAQRALNARRDPERRRLDLRIAPLLQEHETRLRYLRELQQNNTDPDVAETLERMIEAETNRFKASLLALAGDPDLAYPST